MEDFCLEDIKSLFIPIINNYVREAPIIIYNFYEIYSYLLYSIPILLFWDKEYLFF